MNEWSAKELLDGIESKSKISGSLSNKVSKISSTRKAESDCLTFIDVTRKDKQALFNDCRGGIIICDNEVEVSDKPSVCVVQTEQPKVLFSIIANRYFVEKPTFSIHPSATIHPKAKIANDVFIGPNVVIGQSEVGAGTIIYGNAYIFDHVVIGKNVVIAPNATIGFEGFGFNRDEQGIPVQFPHMGRVILEDHVSIGANTCIDRGALDDTVIGEGTKIDNLVHIAHNVKIGKYCYIIANSLIGGSTSIGDFSYVAPSATIKDAISIGEKSLIGMGAVILKSVPENETWIGNPGREISEQLAILSKLKKLA